MSNLAIKSLMCYLADSAVVFPFLFPPLCQMSPPATPVMRCHMHRVGSVPEFTDFGTRRDLSVIKPEFLQSPGHPAPHHCVSTEPNPRGLAQLPPSAQCWAQGTSQDRREEDVWRKTWRNCVKVWKISSIQQSEVCHLSVLWVLGQPLKCRGFVLGIVLVCL